MRAFGNVARSKKEYSRLPDPADDSNHDHEGLYQNERQVSQMDLQLSEYSARFEPNKQSWRLFQDQASRLIFTVNLVVLYLASLKIYEVEGNVPQAQKRAFNTVTIVLSLALGLNFLVRY